MMRKGDIESWVTRHWYAKNKTWLAYALLPFSYLYRAIIFLRRFAYQKKWIKSYRALCPVIIVGNITVGGVGKTPLVIALYFLLKEQGWIPGIVTRGYKGNFSGVALVNDHSDPREVGDEAVLLATRTGAPVMVGRDRVCAVKKLLQETACNIILSDDGLQHYALERDIEIAVQDAARQLGNRLCLPAGPLREPVSRLKSVDIVVKNGGEASECSFSFINTDLINLLDSSKIENIQYLRDKKIHAFAGIGSPERFFNDLRKLGAKVIAHAYPDHYLFGVNDFQKFTPDDLLIMTEKDAVKCRAFAKQNFWFLRVETALNAVFIEDFYKNLYHVSEKMSNFITQ